MIIPWVPDLIVDFPLKTSKEIEDLQQTRELKVYSMVRGAIIG
jgi:hypothetical protein